MNFLNARNIKIWSLVIPSIILFALALFCRTLYADNLQSYLLYPDTEEYFNAAVLLSKGRIDMLRLPVYSLFLYIVSILSGKNIGSDDFVAAVVNLQRIISSVGIVFLYNALRKLTVEKTSVWVKNIIFLLVTIFCAVHPSMINWDFLILTESITIFFMILLLWAYINYLQCERRIYLIVCFLFSGLLLFTKPFYLFLPVILFLNILIKKTGTQAIDYRKNIITAAASIAVIYSLLGWYILINGRQNGYYGITGVGGINSFGKVLQYDMYDLGIDGLIKERIEQDTATYGEVPNPLTFGLRYGYDGNNFSDLKAYAEQIILKHPLRYAVETVKYALLQMRYVHLLTDYCERVFINDWNKWEDGFFNSFFTLYILLLIQFIVISLNFYNKLSFSILFKTRIFLFSIIFYQYLMSLIGAHGEYSRLMAPVYFMIFIAFADIMQQFVTVIPRKKQLQSPHRSCG